MDVLVFTLFIVPWTMTWTCTMMLTGSIVRHGLFGLWRAPNDQYCTAVLLAAVAYWPLFMIYGFAPVFTAIQQCLIIAGLIILEAVSIVAAVRLERQSKVFRPV